MGAPASLSGGVGLAEGALTPEQIVQELVAEGVKPVVLPGLFTDCLSLWTL